MPKHVRAIDVVGEIPEKFVSIRNAREFYIFMEEAEGRSYFEDLEEILERGRLAERDVERVRMLAGFLADIHGIKYRRENAEILYKRRIRDLIGHGECIMGIIDAFGPLEFIMENDFVAYVMKCIPWWGRLRFKSERLSSVHGDYHPGNIRLRGNDFILLDRSRGSWGEPADDVSALGINFIHYAIKDRGGFTGPFAELFKRFIEHYLERTGDEGIFEVCQPFFAFRALVIANPRFYPDDEPETKRKLLEFGYGILDEEKFRIDRIPDIVGK
jgi:aminoglycoside phosphotransferase (APT) family kinase protein